MTTLSESTILTRWTTDLVERMPHIEGERYEIIDGELYVTTQPHFRHQATSDNIAYELGVWSRGMATGAYFQPLVLSFPKIML
jgi:Uma2 family endonuclease